MLLLEGIQLYSDISNAGHTTVLRCPLWGTQMCWDTITVGQTVLRHL